MYVPSAFREEDLATLHTMIREARLANLVTSTQDGLVATPLPLFLVPDEGPFGTLYGHVARANPQWRLAPRGEALVLFDGPEAYVSPAWYASKQEHGKVVPTWNYVAIHAYGAAEFFEDADRLLDVVTRLTDLHERDRAGRDHAEREHAEQEHAGPWAVTDAPEPFVRAQLRGIVGVRMAITRLEGKRKLSQNRSAEDRAGVAAGLAASDRAGDQELGALVRTGS